MNISKKNEVYLVLDDMTDSTRQELTEFFTFEVPGASFMPSFRSRMWDGKIRLFSPATGEIYVGLLEYVKGFCQKNKIDYIVEEGVENDRSIVRQVVRDFIRSLRPKSGGKSLKVRDYQIDAVHHGISRDRALLVSPTASGKSLIIYSLVRYYHMMGLKTLILVPTTSLVEQMYSDFEDYGWSSGTYCQKVYQGYPSKVEKDVVISTWQSIYKLPKKYFEQFGCDNKSLADLKIKCIVLKHKNIRERMTYAEELQFLGEHERRNEFIAGLLMHLPGNTLCLYQLVEKHGKPLHEAVKKSQSEGFFDDKLRKVFFIYGKTSTTEREDIRSIVEGETNSITIASYGTFSTGINIRNIHNIVLASPSKSRIRVLQSIGRGLRQGENKDSVLIFDIADDMTFRNQSNFTLNHFQERIQIYNTEQFNYEISRINLI